MVFIFNLFLLALVLMSFVLVVGVPVAYASGQNWDQSKRLIWLGSGVWISWLYNLRHFCRDYCALPNEGAQ
jgi:photosystem II PsbZ protein